MKIFLARKNAQKFRFLAESTRISLENTLKETAELSGFLEVKNPFKSIHMYINSFKWISTEVIFDHL